MKATFIRFTASAIGTIFLLGGSYLWACKVSHVDSAEEITQKAEVIVRVQVIDYKPDKPDGGTVKFKVLEVIKGEFKPTMLSLDGQTEKYEGANDEKPPYQSVRPGGKHGSCFARDYKLNGEFLLFLQEDSPYWSALAAVNEEVSGANDPWVWWVKGYLASIAKDATKK